MSDPLKPGDNNSSNLLSNPSNNTSNSSIHTINNDESPIKRSNLFPENIIESSLSTEKLSSTSKSKKYSKISEYNKSQYTQLLENDLYQSFYQSFSKDNNGDNHNNNQTSLFTSDWSNSLNVALSDNDDDNDHDPDGKQPLQVSDLEDNDFNSNNDNSSNDEDLKKLGCLQIKTDNLSPLINKFNLNNNNNNQFLNKSFFMNRNNNNNNDLLSPNSDFSVNSSNLDTPITSMVDHYNGSFFYFNNNSTKSSVLNNSATISQPSTGSSITNPPLTCMDQRLNTSPQRLSNPNRFSTLLYQSPIIDNNHQSEHIFNNNTLLDSPSSCSTTSSNDYHDFSIPIIPMKIGEDDPNFQDSKYDDCIDLKQLLKIENRKKTQKKKLKALKKKNSKVNKDNSTTNNDK